MNRSEIKENFRPSITANTDLYAVFGHPVAHSLSPVMHNRAFMTAGINAVYMAFDVKDIKSAMDAMRTLNIKGASITIPHKVDLIAALDELDPEAKEIGAVNTVVNSGGHLKGCNSDGKGALLALESRTSLNGKHVAIIGAGGAARAIGFEIRKKAGKLTIYNRSPKRGENLAQELEANFRPLEDCERIRCDILIHTTSMGMFPDVRKLAVNSKNLQAGMVVMDIVYTPLKTALIQEAEAKGCTTIDGAAMFVYQGALMFQWGPGRNARGDDMRAAVLKALLGQPSEKDNPCPSI
jgi:shikimate dehydrogenase